MQSPSFGLKKRREGNSFPALLKIMNIKWNCGSHLTTTNGRCWVTGTAPRKPVTDRTEKLVPGRSSEPLSLTAEISYNCSTRVSLGPIFSLFGLYENG